MAAFPRAIIPNFSSPMEMPGAMISFGQSGKVQQRGTVQTGRRWVETLRPFAVSSAEGRALIAFVNHCWSRGVAFTIQHYGYLTKNGLGTGSPTVNGASQTGDSLSTNNWTGSNPVLRAGDLIRIAGISQVFDVIEDAPNLAGGIAAIKINPPIFAGSSPAGGAAITHSGVLLNAIVAAPPNFPPFGVNEYVIGQQLTFAEVV